MIQELLTKQGFIRLEPSNYRQIATVTCKEEMAHQLFWMCTSRTFPHEMSDALLINVVVFIFTVLVFVVFIRFVLAMPSTPAHY